MIADIAHWAAHQNGIVGDPHHSSTGSGRRRCLNSDWMAGAEEQPDPELRFGPAIAHVPTHPLLQGRNTETSRYWVRRRWWKKSLPPDLLPHFHSPHRYRRFENALQLVRNHPEPKFHWVGGIDSYSMPTGGSVDSAEACAKTSRTRNCSVTTRLHPVLEIAEISQDGERCIARSRSYDLT